MSELHTIQKNMLAWLMNKDDAIKTVIVDTGEVNKVSVEQRLAVYGNAYGYRLIDALSENYPAIHTLMGDDDFYTMSYAYMATYPSHHFSLRYFGHQLSRFFSEFKPDQKPDQFNSYDMEMLAEMARFEWMLRFSFDSADIDVIALQDLQNIPPENWGGIQFVFHPSVTRLDLNWNTPQLWSAIDEESDPIPAEQNEYPVPWLLWRKELLTYYRSLDVDEAWALDQALNRMTFADLCEGECEWVDEEHAPARVAGFVSQWIDDHLLIAINVVD